MTTARTTILWFRNDLRLEDNPALTQAVLHGGGIIPLYIWSPEEEGRWPPGAASKWWLHHSLNSLNQELLKHGAKLIVRSGKSLDVLREVIHETNAQTLFWNRRYEPSIIERDSLIKSELTADGIEVRSFNGSLLYEPWTILNKQGKPFQVFTPFWKACLQQGQPAEPVPAPKKFPPLAKNIPSTGLDSLELMPKIHWDAGLEKAWKPGAPHALKALKSFMQSKVEQYHEMRDRPDIEGVSHLSPYLHFGEISPRTVWHAILQHQRLDQKGVECYLRQLGWREFAHHLLYHFPHTPEHPLRKEFSAFPWKYDNEHLKTWHKGNTGYPFVDAGMRQLWKTGWMHNRVRMVVGSFLVKDLLLSWTEGAKWFWDTLVDADLANNTLGWQWVGGCGADAAPYFRIFNPVSQGEKFDPEGLYVREWVPELSRLPDKWIHRPWEAPDAILQNAGVALGKTYPKPIVDHDIARKEALEAFKRRRNDEA